MFSSKQERHKKDDSYYDDNSVYEFKRGSRDGEDEELDECDDRLPLV